jgi:predicted transcriptional regulator
MSETLAAPVKKRRGIQLKDGDVSVEIPTHKSKSGLFGECVTRLVQLDRIIADTRFQFRVDGLDQAYVADLVDIYDQADSSGVDSSMPPIVVFSSSDAVLWLSDGFHRHAAMVTAGLVQVEAVVYSGDRRAAMRYALQANGHHGKKRTLADAAFAYKAAVSESLVDPFDVKAVSKLLGISERWAREITREARDKANAERDATIQRLAQEGKTQRNIAEQVGVDQKTVSNVLREEKRNTSKIPQAPHLGDRIPDPDKSASLTFQAPASSLDLAPSAPDAESSALQEAKRAFAALKGPDLARFKDWAKLNDKGFPPRYWVPRSEQLPKPSQFPVLGLFKGVPVLVADIVGRDWVVGPDHSRQYYSESDFSHWMMIPKNP